MQKNLVIVTKHWALSLSQQKMNSDEKASNSDEKASKHEEKKRKPDLPDQVMDVPAAASLPSSKKPVVPPSKKSSQPFFQSMEITDIMDPEVHGKLDFDDTLHCHQPTRTWSNFYPGCPGLLHPDHISLPPTLLVTVHQLSVQGNSNEDLRDFIRQCPLGNKVVQCHNEIFLERNKPPNKFVNTGSFDIQPVSQPPVPTQREVTSQHVSEATSPNACGGLTEGDTAVDLPDGKKSFFAVNLAGEKIYFDIDSSGSSSSDSNSDGPADDGIQIRTDVGSRRRKGPKIKRTPRK